MDANFEACLSFTIGHGPQPGGEEGGYSDDPRDPGGITMRGITLDEYRRWTGRRDVTAAVMQALTRADVAPIYRTSYWLATSCPALPAGVDLMVFDEAVNAGPGVSAMLLQRLLGVDPDGHIGPITALAMRGVNDLAGFIHKLHDAHLARYQDLDDWPIYGHDWGARCDRRRDTALAMLPLPAGAPATT
jgi:lysozyme family protein